MTIVLATNLDLDLDSTGRRLAFGGRRAPRTRVMVWVLCIPELEHLLPELEGEIEAGFAFVYVFERADSEPRAGDEVDGIDAEFDLAFEARSDFDFDTDTDLADFGDDVLLVVVVEEWVVLVVSVVSETALEVMVLVMVEVC